MVQEFFNRSETMDLSPGVSKCEGKKFVTTAAI